MAIGALLAGCAEEEPVTTAPAEEDTEDEVSTDDADDGDQSDDLSGGLERDGGAGGSTLDHDDGIEAPSLDHETLELFADLEATETEDGTIVEVEDDLLFDFDDDQLKPEADEILDDLADLADGTGDVPVSVVGHTDGVGSDEYNADLSQRRADAVIAGLTDRGVDESRLTATGVGSDEPVREEGGDDDEEARAANRRVEVIFEGIDLDD